MSDETIKIGDLQFTLHSGKPFEYDGVHARRELAGIDLDIHVYSDTEVRRMENLFKQDIVEIEDPFAGRQYEGTLHSKSYRYQEGSPRTQYHFEVRELDEAAKFDFLEIEGHRFHVIKNTESLYDDDIGIHTLLRLSSDEFRTFQSLTTSDSVQVKRIGVDESSITRLFRGTLSWSSHDEGGDKFYKQIARLWTTDSPTRIWPVASLNVQVAQSEMIIELSARFQALVTTLVDNGQISGEDRNNLLSAEWKTLITADEEFSLRSKLLEVSDAELEQL